MVNYPERVTLYPYRELTITSKVQECHGREFAAKLGEFDYSICGSTVSMVRKREVSIQNVFFSFPKVSLLPDLAV